MNDPGGTVEWPRVAIGGWSWQRQANGSVLIGLGSEYAEHLTAAQWDEVVRAVGGITPQTGRQP